MSEGMKDFQKGDRIIFKSHKLTTASPRVYTITKIFHLTIEVEGYEGKLYLKEGIELYERAPTSEPVALKECQCTSRQIFECGCRCGFQKPYEATWC